MNLRLLFILGLVIFLSHCRIPNNQNLDNEIQIDELCFSKSLLDNYIYENVDGCGNAVLFKLISSTEILVVKINSGELTQDCKEFTSESSDDVEVILYQYPKDRFPDGISYFPLCTDIEIVMKEKPNILSATSFKLNATIANGLVPNQILCSVIIKDCSFTINGVKRDIYQQYFHEVSIGKLAG